MDAAGGDGLEEVELTGMGQRAFRALERINPNFSALREVDMKVVLVKESSSEERFAFQTHQSDVNGPTMPLNLGCVEVNRSLGTIGKAGPYLLLERPTQRSDRVRR